MASILVEIQTMCFLMDIHILYKFVVHAFAKNVFNVGDGDNTDTKHIGIIRK